MPITVQHQPSFKSIGDVSSEYGKFQINREDVQKAQDNAFQLQRIDKQAQINEQFAQNNFEREQQAADLALQRDLEKNQDLTEYEYTTKQKMAIDNINNQISDVQMNMELSQDDKDYAVRELEFKKIGIKPQSKPRSSPFPKGQDVNDIWTDKSTGVVYTRNENGEPKVLVKSKDSPEGSAMETISTKEYVDLYEKTYKSMVFKNPMGQETPPDADKVAEQVEKILASRDLIKIKAQVYNLPPNFQKIYTALTNPRIDAKTGKTVPPLSPKAAMDIVNKLKGKK